MKLVRDFFVDSISGSGVQLRRKPGVTPLPDTCAGAQMHQVNIVTGLTSATNAEVGRNAFWETGCITYRVTVERIT